MKRIIQNSTSYLEIKKSKFITKLYYVTTLDEINTYLQEIKKEYKDATHYCYAYVIDGQKKSSDDGEPGGTAGIPMMEILNKQDINYILCIVIRYFGGIKLGAGGLIRAYSNCVRQALEEAEIKELEAGYHIRIQTDYEKENQLIEILGKENIVHKSYLESLEIEALIPVNTLEKLNRFEVDIIENIWI